MHFELNQKVTWKQSPRVGYGYVLNVPAVVREVSVSGKRVLIEAQLERGGTRLTYVKPTSLVAAQ